MADLFVSYAREDEVRVASLVAVLEAESWSVFWGGSAYSRGSDVAWPDLDKALQDARCVIVVWTKHSISS